jgi:hypothetical protein
VSEKIDLTAGARVLATQTYSKTYYGGILARDTLYNRWNWSPNVRFRYKFGQKEFARIVYRGRVNQPTIQQMEPVRNNSDLRDRWRQYAQDMGTPGKDNAFGFGIPDAAGVIRGGTTLPPPVDPGTGGGGGNVTPIGGGFTLLDLIQVVPAKMAEKQGLFITTV